MKKALPIGVDNFEKLITNGYYFVDKSLFIKELLDLQGGSESVYPAEAVRKDTESEYAPLFL